MKKFNVLTAVLVATLSVMTTQAVMADPQAHGRGEGMEHRRGGPEGIERMLKGLDLTDSQRQQIDKLQTEFLAKKPEPEAHKAFAEQLKNLIRADVFDEVAARQLLEQQQAQMLDKAVARLKLQHDIRNILTAEQKAKLDERMARMQDKMLERKKS